MHQHDHIQKPGGPGAWYKSRWGLALIGFATVSLLLLVYEHRVHIPFGNLLVILPLFVSIGLHSLMHGSHGGYGGHGGRSRDASNPATDKPADDSEGGRR